MARTGAEVRVSKVHLMEERKTLCQSRDSLYTNSESKCYKGRLEPYLPGLFSRPRALEPKEEMVKVVNGLGSGSGSGKARSYTLL